MAGAVGIYNNFGCEDEEWHITYVDIVGTAPGESGRTSGPPLYVPRNVFDPPMLIVLRIFGPLISNVI